jgi:hypothetical protein
MNKDIIHNLVKGLFPYADAVNFFDSISIWREGLETHFKHGGNEDDAFGGLIWSFHPVAFISNNELIAIELQDGDIGGSTLISQSSHLTAHTIGHRNNPGVTIKELLTRYAGVKIEGVVILLEERDTNKPDNWDESRIEIVAID